MYYFYDTSSLLAQAKNSINFDNGNIIISSITLTELEEIKTSPHKDEEIKYNARLLLHQMENVEIFIFKEHMLDEIVEKDLQINNDMRILATAVAFDKLHPDEVIFVTEDLCLKYIANLFFGNDSIISIGEGKKDTYTGYKEVYLTEEEMSELYMNLQENIYDLNINEYLIVRDKDGALIDKFCWTGEEYRYLNYKSFNSRQFGEIKPMKDDVYQMIAMDAMYHNQLTMIKGPAGSGKSYLALGYLFSQLERHKIDKIVIFCNTVAAKNSAKLGFYPGTKDEKLMDSQIGNFLASKLGSKLEVERLINNETLVLLPMADIRGYDTTGLNAGIYISEAQNMDITLMKLALQRIGKDCKCILDGDCATQVDDISYAGNNNGMRRVSQIFRGTEVYGEATLKNIHRSRIAEIAEQL